MVVDDEPQSMKLMRSLAAPFNHTVVTFEDRREAGERAEKQRFDVAFLGMRLPQLDGLELVRQIRSCEPNRDTTIGMLSATDDFDSLRKACGEGGAAAVTRPRTAARYGPMLAAMDSPGW